MTTEARQSPGPSSWGAEHPGLDLTLAHPTHEDHDDTRPRCRACHHPLTARQSIALELGPVCAHRLAQRLALAAGAPVVLGERDGELIAWIGRAP